MRAASVRRALIGCAICTTVGPSCMLYSRHSPCCVVTLEKPSSARAGSAGCECDRYRLRPEPSQIWMTTSSSACDRSPGEPMKGGATGSANWLGSAAAICFIW
ncbi:hypothetical protein D9M72_374510 [compost metagenome]